MSRSGALPSAGSGTVGPNFAAHTLSAAAAVGATTLTLDRAPTPPVNAGWVAIDAFSTGCEIRKVSAVTGSTITLLSASATAMPHALQKAHAANAPVIFFQGKEVMASWFGAAGDDTTLDDAALQQGMIQARAQSLALNGEGKTYRIRLPLIEGDSSELRNARIHPKTSGGAGVQFAPVDPDNALVCGQNGKILTGASASVATGFITATGHGIPTDAPNDGKQTIMFKAEGGTLPAPLVEGRMYFPRNVTADTFKVSRTIYRFVRPPFGLRALASTTGGTLATGNKYVKVTALNAVGETVGSAEIIVAVTGPTASFELSWFPSIEATSYRVYTGTAAGAQDTYWTVPAPATGFFQDRLKFTVTGTGGTAGTVPATNTASTDIDITADGSGFTVYTGMTSLGKHYWRDVYLEGLSWTSGIYMVNGVIGSFQQPGFFDKVRIDSCGIGWWVNGQHHVVVNFESIACRWAVMSDEMSYLYFHGFNAEQCQKALLMLASRGSGVAGSEVFAAWRGGGHDIHINGWHSEMVNVETPDKLIADRVALDIFSGSNIVVEPMLATMGVVAGPPDANGKVIRSWAATGRPQDANGYTIRNLNINSGSTTAPWALYDIDRNEFEDAFVDLGNFHKEEIHAPLKPSSESYVDKHPYLWLGTDGRRIERGSTNAARPIEAWQAGTNMAASQRMLEYRDKTGTPRSGVNANAVPVTSAPTPADADLLNGQGSWAWDPALGVPVFKGKKTDGTVVSTKPLDRGVLTTKGDLLVVDVNGNPVRLPRGNTNDVLTSDATDPTLGVKWAPAGGAGAGISVAPFRVPYHRSGYYYCPIVGTPSSAGAGTQDTANYCPIWIDADWAITAVSIRVNTAVAGSVLRVGLYANDTTMMPAALVQDFGTIDTSVVGIRDSAPLTYTVTAGIYWLVSIPQLAAPANIDRISILDAGIGVNSAQATFGPYIKSALPGALANPAVAPSGASGSAATPMVLFKSA